MLFESESWRVESSSRRWSVSGGASDAVLILNGYSLRPREGNRGKGERLFVEELAKDNNVSNT